MDSRFRGNDDIRLADDIHGVAKLKWYEYDRVNLDTLWDIVQNHIPPLIEQLEDLISKEAPIQEWKPC